VGIETIGYSYPIATRSALAHRGFPGADSWRRWGRARVRWRGSVWWRLLEYEVKVSAVFLLAAVLRPRTRGPLRYVGKRSKTGGKRRSHSTTKEPLEVIGKRKTAIATKRWVFRPHWRVRAIARACCGLQGARRGSKGVVCDRQSHTTAPAINGMAGEHGREQRIAVQDRRTRLSSALIYRLRGSGRAANVAQFDYKLLEEGKKTTVETCQSSAAQNRRQLHPRVTVGEEVENYHHCQGEIVRHDRGLVRVIDYRV